MSEATNIQPITETTEGPVIGKFKRGVFQFCGIPYAAPPVGERRFKAAEPPTSRSDILDATRFSPAAPQLPSVGMTNTAPVDWDEDCLYLNICTPAIDDRKRPVLVWIHGGNYRSGQGGIPWYNGASFATNGDIVVVSINYRLGALGFTDLSRFGDEYSTSGVNGTLDQIKALQWVQNNITNFGGDPARVTIAGESAGGFSVGTLLGCEEAQGLFHRAIPQSGAAHHTLSKKEGQQVTDLLLEELNVDSAESLQEAAAIEILDAQNRVDSRYSAAIESGVMAFYPVVGTPLLPVGPREAIQEGMGKDVVVLTGSNKDENTLFVMQAISEERLAKQAGHYGKPSLADDYREILPGASATDIYVAMGTDFSFKLPAIRLAEDRAATGARTWLYQFDWESRAPHLKATHALEIPFMFNTLTAPGVDVFLGEGELPQALADEMHGVWTRFIQGHDPEWPMYESDNRVVWHFDSVSGLVENGEASRLKAWQGIR